MNEGYYYNYKGIKKYKNYCKKKGLIIFRQFENFILKN